MELSNVTFTFNAILVFLISGIHFYWVFGGKWGLESVFPEIKNKPKLKPSKFMTVAVAILFFVIGLLILNATTYYSIEFINKHQSKVILLIAIIFGIRAIGEFKYLGLFKKEKTSLFAINDTKYYTPLCIWISITLIISNYLL